MANILIGWLKKKNGKNDGKKYIAKNISLNQWATCSKNDLAWSKNIRRLIHVNSNIPLVIQRDGKNFTSACVVISHVMWCKSIKCQWKYNVLIWVKEYNTRVFQK